mmetsp:Transcript_40261/g.41071  ORF Transcript_40261/g.41071 Transcript_40261/m.41071 type:complete len:153 (+) Transcript_40261:183-641(+)
MSSDSDIEPLGLEIESRSTAANIISDTNTAENSTKKMQDWTVSNVLLSLSLFIFAGLLEIGGGYLMWRGIRDQPRKVLFIIFGSLVLVAYGVVPTLQPVESFGRTFAVYGGFFIILSYVFAVIVDNMRLDTGDYIGGSIAIFGVCFSWFWPR